MAKADLSFKVLPSRLRITLGQGASLRRLAAKL
jgi:hypothetical protein